MHLRAGRAHELGRSGSRARGTSGPGAGEGAPPSRRRRWLGALLLLASAAPFRFAQLSDLSFYADEETTALAVRSVIDTGTASMPSGMEYRRALPYTWLTAAVVARAETDGEGAYRLVSAAIGTLTPPALFLVGAGLVGAGPAFVAGALLAVSEWHIAFSRMARMYAPFLFFYVLAGGLLWKWATTGRRAPLLWGTAALAGAISLHALGLFAVQFAILPLAFAGLAAVSAVRLLGFAAVAAGLGWSYHLAWVRAPFSAWVDDAPLASLQSGPPPPVIPTVSAGPLLVAALLVAAAVAIALAVRDAARAVPAGRSSEDDPAEVPAPQGGDRPGARGGPDLWPRIAVSLAAGTFCGFLFIGQLGGALACAGIGLLADPAYTRRLALRYWRFLAVAASVALAWVVAMVMVAGVTEGLKAVAYFPYPYLVGLVSHQPLVWLLAAGAALAALSATWDGERPRALALSVLLPVLAIGIVSRWGPSRYFLHVYPFVLLLAGWALVHGLRWVARRWSRLDRRATIATAGAAVLAISGVLGKHGVPQATRIASLEHGEPMSAALHLMPFRPDHANPGRYVRSHAAAEDVVIAVDVLEQTWYAGRVDWWLRSLEDARPFLYEDSSGFRDIYTSTRLLNSEEELDGILADAPPGRVWLITSGEIAPDDTRSLTPEQRRMTARLERAGTVVFTGRDGATRVYCVRCSASSGGGSGMDSDPGGSPRESPPTSSANR